MDLFQKNNSEELSVEKRFNNLSPEMQEKYKEQAEIFQNDPSRIDAYCKDPLIDIELLNEAAKINIEMQENRKKQNR